MIAELFYPKELKDVVADLCAKGDLNEKALKNLNAQTVPFSILFLIFTGVLVAAYGLLGFSFLLIIAPVFISTEFILIRRSYFKNMAPYLLGEKKRGIIVDSYYINPRFPTRVIKVKSQETGKIIKISPGAIWSKRSGHSAPRVGEAINFYEGNNKKYGVVPDCRSVKECFCLMRSLVEGESL